MYWELTRAPSPRIPTATCCCSKTALQISAEAFTAPKPEGKTVKHRRLFKLEKIKNKNAEAMKSANIEGNAQDPPC